MTTKTKTSKLRRVYIIQVRCNLNVQYWDCYSTRPKALRMLKQWFAEGVTAKWWAPNTPEPDWTTTGTLYPIGGTPYSFLLLPAKVS